MRETVQRYNMYATFMVKPMQRGRARAHIHQSVIDLESGNLFTTAEGEPSQATWYMGGLQRYTLESLVYAPNVNSYRRLAPDISAPSTSAGVLITATAFACPTAMPLTADRKPFPALTQTYLAITASLASGLLGTPARSRRSASGHCQRR